MHKPAPYKVLHLTGHTYGQTACDAVMSKIGIPLDSVVGIPRAQSPPYRSMPPISPTMRPIAKDYTGQNPRDRTRQHNHKHRAQPACTQTRSCPPGKNPVHTSERFLGRAHNGRQYHNGQRAGSAKSWTQLPVACPADQDISIAEQAVDDGRDACTVSL